MKRTPSTRTKPRRLRRLITGTLLTISLTIGGLVTTATPAEAANYVYGCFKTSGVYDLWGTTAKLQYWTGAGWATVASSPLGPKNALITGYSCVGWQVPTQYYFTIFVDHRLNPSSFPWWWGAPSTGLAWTPQQGLYDAGIPYALPGDQTWILVGQVTCYGCQPI